MQHQLLYRQIQYMLIIIYISFSHSELHYTTHAQHVICFIILFLYCFIVELEITISYKGIQYSHVYTLQLYALFLYVFVALLFACDIMPFKYNNSECIRSG